MFIVILKGIESYIEAVVCNLGLCATSREGQKSHYNRKELCFHICLSFWVCCLFCYDVVHNGIDVLAVPHIVPDEVPFEIRVFGVEERRQDLHGT